MIHSPSCFNSQYFAILGLSNLTHISPKGTWSLIVVSNCTQNSVSRQSLSKIQALEKRKPRTIIHLPEKAPFIIHGSILVSESPTSTRPNQPFRMAGTQTTAGGTEGQRTERLDWEHPQHRRFNA